MTHLHPLPGRQHCGAQASDSALRTAWGAHESIAKQAFSGQGKHTQRGMQNMTLYTLSLGSQGSSHWKPLGGTPGPLCDLLQGAAETWATLASRVGLDRGWKNSSTSPSLLSSNVSLLFKEIRKGTSLAGSSYLCWVRGQAWLVLLKHKTHRKIDSVSLNSSLSPFSLTLRMSSSDSPVIHKEKKEIISITGCCFWTTYCFCI